MILVDSNILIDILKDDPVWAEWSTDHLTLLGAAGEGVINPIIYAELSIGFSDQATLDLWLRQLEVSLEETPANALFRAGKAFASYRESGGPRTSLLPDFLIGAHADVMGYAILTRDTRRFRTYFPAVRLIAPDMP